VPQTRLERLIADRSPLSRSVARAAIRRGRVTVDGARVRDPSAAVDPRSALTLDGRPLGTPPVLAWLHKPPGVHSTVGDPQGRPNLTGVAATLLALGFHPVGRLDADTSGLLPFSRDGALTQRLLHPRHGIEKTYEAHVSPAPGPDLGARLAAGVDTALGTHTARLDQLDGARVVLTVTEGKHRMVRRMLANLGHPVDALHRVRFGAIVLAGLPPGAWQLAAGDDLAWAEALAAD
jgi:pseudouridine synthase